MRKHNRCIEIKSELQHIAPPDQYKPQKPSELIGPARALAEMLLAHAQKIQRNGSTYKKLLFGQWGNGKSRIASMLSRTLAANPIDIEKINGRNLTIDVVREWQQNCAYGSLFGGWKVKWIEEVDLVPPIAQDLLLTYLDDLPPRTAVIATSNRDMRTLSDRFDTRFAPIEVKSPTDSEIADFLVKQWRVPRKAADFIAIGACGNVRDAFLRTANFLILGDVTERPKPSPNFLAKSKTAVARAAWQNSRNGNSTSM
jgi:replication-associated recombination protein RarA